MIFGNEIVNESVLSESGMLFDIIIENYALKCEYYNNCPEECLAEAKTKLKMTSEIKYAMKKFREKERRVPELKKDIEQCEKALVKVDQEMEKYKGSSKPKKFVNNLLTILNPFGGNEQLRISFPGDNGTNPLNGSIYMKQRGELDSAFAFYERDLILTKQELTHTLKYLKAELKKAEQ